MVKSEHEGATPIRDRGEPILRLVRYAVVVDVSLCLYVSAPPMGRDESWLHGEDGMCSPSAATGMTERNS